MSGERKVGSGTAIRRRAPEPEKTRAGERRKMSIPNIGVYTCESDVAG